MYLLRLALASLNNRRFTALLTVFAIALSVCLLLAVERVRSETRASFASTISGTDLVVGARSGSVNLLLYSVFRIGNATNNIRWESYQHFAEHPRVDWAIPISLGDSHRGYRVMGTSSAYFEHYRYGRKQPLQLAGRQPRAAVAHLDHKGAGAVAHPQQHTACRRVADGVHQQVVEDTPQQQRRRRVLPGCVVAHQTHALDRRCRRMALAGIGQQRPQRQAGRHRL